MIGTVEVLRARVYTAPDGGDVMVEPDVYPLHIDDDGIIRWVMSGRRSKRQGGFESLGDGLFTMSSPHDELTGDDEEPVQSRPFTRSEFREFLATEPVVREGHPEQRLRVRVLVEIR